MIQPLNFATEIIALKPRDKATYKHQCGHVLVIGGDFGLPGAVCLAAVSALRTGAGLVSVATHQQHANAITAYQPELMVHAIDTIKHLPPLLDKASVIVLGPGLGESAWSETVFSNSLQTQKPMIIDASALTLLAKLKPQYPNPSWILTPHPGEAATLLGCTPQMIQADRLTALKQLQQQYKCHIVLKGAETLICTTEQNCYINPSKQPAMATAGMGDVLSGILAGLAAQGMGLDEAARLGVCLHTRAAELAGNGADRGLIASDLFLKIKHIYTEQT